MAPEEISCDKDLSLIMAPQEILVSLVSEWWIFVVNNLIRFASSLYHFHLCGSGSVFGKRIRIHKVPEKGSNLAPDPQNWFYSNAMFLFLMSFFYLNIYYICGICLHCFRPLRPCRSKSRRLRRERSESWRTPTWTAWQGTRGWPSSSTRPSRRARRPL